MSRYTLEIITSNRADQVTELRTDAFRERYGDRVDLQKLAWNENDERFLNIGLVEYGSDELVSVLRLAYLKTPDDFFKVMLLPFSTDRFELPVLALGRGATLQTVESQGLHSVLRQAAFKMAKMTQARAVVGTMEEGSPRLKQMADLGYEFIRNEAAWSGFLKNEKPITVGILRVGAALDRAIDLLGERIRSRDLMLSDDVDYEAAVQKLHATKSFES